MATSRKFELERLIGLATAVCVVGTVLYLVIRNQPFSDLNLVTLMRIVLAVAMGILGATIPGFLSIEYKSQGLVIRAAGALALVLLTYFFSPKVEMLNLKLPKADVAVATPTRIDLRASTGGSSDPSDRDKGVVMATVDLGYRNRAQPAETAVLNHTSLSFALDGRTHSLPWIYFANLHDEQLGKWLAIERSAESVPIAQGAVVSKEIMHVATDYLWSDFIAQWRKSTEARSAFTLTSVIDDHTITTVCSVDSVRWRDTVEAHIRTNEGRIPMRLTMCCLERPVSTAAASCLT
jgi:hypothetical protein